MKLRHMIPFFWSLCDIGSITADEKCNVVQNDRCKKKKDKPYICGTDLCEYPNACFAIKAGYDYRNDCKPKEYCRRRDVSCTGESNPQLCGNHQCVYNSPCLAEAQGYNVSHDCEPITNSSCITPTGVCTSRKYRPYICGKDQKCEYDNLCLAKAAGYNLNYDCKPKDSCRKRNNAVCTKEYRPLLCGITPMCKYDNACFADDAGYDVNTECNDVNNTATSVPSNNGRFDPPTPSPTTTNENNQTVGPMNNNDTLSGIPSSAPTSRYATIGSPEVKCPIPNRDVICYMKHEPYSCGADSCIYSNDCIARAANYNITEDCVKVNDMDNSATSVPSNDGRFDPPTPSPTTNKWDLTRFSLHFFLIPERSHCS